MHFCTVCENMYYIRLTGEEKDQLTYYCRKCGHEDDELIASLENICVWIQHYREFKIFNVQMLHVLQMEKERNLTHQNQIYYILDMTTPI